MMTEACLIGIFAAVGINAYFSYKHCQTSQEISKKLDEICTEVKRDVEKEAKESLESARSIDTFERTVFLVKRWISEREFHGVSIDEMTEAFSKFHGLIDEISDQCSKKPFLATPPTLPLTQCTSNADTKHQG